jgi:hypothetical protein
MRRAAGPCFHHTQKRVPCPARVLCERAGLLADIAAADHPIHAKPPRRRLPSEIQSTAPSSPVASCRASVLGRSAEVPSAGSGQALRWQAFALRRPALPQDESSGSRLLLPDQAYSGNSGACPEFGGQEIRDGKFGVGKRRMRDSQFGTTSSASPLFILTAGIPTR